MKRALLSAILIAAIGPADAQELWRVAGGETLGQATQIARSEFSVRRVLDLCRIFIQANPSYKIARYFVVTDRTDAIDNLRGPGVTDIDFPDWLRRYKLESPTPPATAELIKVRGEAIVRLRFADGQIAQQVIGNGDPLQIDFRGEIVSVLEVSPIPPGIIMRKPYVGGAHLFVQTSRAWTLTLAEDFNKFLREKAGVAITLEDGWWFAGEPTYPIYNRFLLHMDPPTFNEFKRHARFYCGDLSAGCIQTGPAKRQ